jgi:hypothetical protein
LTAVVAAAAIAGLAATSGILLRSAVRSESLQGQLQSMSPLGGGLEMTSLAHADDPVPPGVPALARSSAGLQPPVVTEMTSSTVGNISAAGTQVVPMWRQGALQHVTLLSPPSSNGVWISSSLARATRLRAGGTLLLAQSTHMVRFRVAGIYRELDADLSNPYWQNFIQDIRSTHADSPPPPTFVLMPKSVFVSFAGRRSLVVRHYELAVDTHDMTLVAAQSLERRFAAIRTALATSRSTRRSFGCIGKCSSSSLLSSALAISDANVAAVGGTITLLSAFMAVLAVAAAVGAGIFLSARRAREVVFLQLRGERPATVWARTVLEVALPALVAAVAGAGIGIAALHAFAPGGSIDAGTVCGAFGRAAVAGALTVLAVASGATASFLGGITVRAPRGTGVLPWALAAVVAGGALVVATHSGHGVTRTDAGTQPRFEIFLAPALIGAGLAGLAVWCIRLVPRGELRDAPVGVFLLVRRVLAARGLLVTAVVFGAAAFASLASSEMMSASLDHSVADKAFVATGGDLTAFVDRTLSLPRSLPFPVAIVTVDSTDAALDGGPVTVVAGDPRLVAPTLIRADVGAQIRSLAHAASQPLPVVAAGDVPTRFVLDVGGRQIQAKVAARAHALPGALTGRPTVFVSSSALVRAARGPLSRVLAGADSLLWARGDPAAIQRALTLAHVDIYYVSTIGDLRATTAVSATTRTYGYFEWIGGAAAILAVASALLYLQARQRRQHLASALVRRMGMTVAADAGALAAEASLITALAGVCGLAAAVLCAAVSTSRVDPLAAWPPPPALVLPWATLAIAFAGAVVVAALAGAAAPIASRRRDVVEELRA